MNLKNILILHSVLVVGGPIDKLNYANLQSRWTRKSELQSCWVLLSLYHSKTSVASLHKMAFEITAPIPSYLVTLSGLWSDQWFHQPCWILIHSCFRGRWEWMSGRFSPQSIYLKFWQCSIKLIHNILRLLWTMELQLSCLCSSFFNV